MAVVSKSAPAVRTPTPVAAPRPSAANPFVAARAQPQTVTQPQRPTLNQNVTTILTQQQAARDAVARQQAAQAQAAAQAQQAQMAARQQAAQQQAAQAQLAQQNALQAHLDQVARDTAVRQQAATAAAQQQAAQQAAARASAQQAAQAQQAEQIRAANAAYAAQQAAKTAPAPAPQPVTQPVPQPAQQAPLYIAGDISPVGGGRNWVQHNPDGSFTNYLGTFNNQLDFQKAQLPEYIQLYNQPGSQVTDPTQQFSDLYKSNPELFQSMKVNQQAAQTGMINTNSHMSPILQLNAENGGAWMNNATGQNLGTGTTPLGATVDQFGMYQPNTGIMALAVPQPGPTGVLSPQSSYIPTPYSSLTGPA